MTVGRLLVPALLGALALASPAGAQLQERVRLMPGVTYERQVDFTLHGPVVMHVIEAPQPDGSLYRLAPALSNDAVVATQTLTRIEQSYESDATVAGVNGDYFDPNPGEPQGMLMSDGVLVSPPDAHRSSLGISPDGLLQIGRVSFTGIWRGTGQRRPFLLNEPPSASLTTLYTSAWGPTTPAASGPVTADVIPSLPPTRPNTDLSGTVSQVVGNGDVPIPQGGAVLVSRGSQAPILARDAPAGTSLYLRLALTPDWSGLTGAIGGGPVLVQNGQPIFRADEDIAASLLNPRSPRSAVGQLANGRIVLVTVDGGGGGYSVGMTNFELALAMTRLGAVRAMALGSGAAATMAFEGTVLNQPKIQEQPISDALLLLYAGVYVPEPSTNVISPNGDGLDDSVQLGYKVVRPSKVTATITGGGITRVLASGSVDPGLHTFTFDGHTADGKVLPEGGYRFTVTATDDTGRTTTAQRGFAINDTLASLAVSPTSVRLAPNRRVALTVSFTLARAASVRVTVETASGFVVRTLAATTLQAGEQRFTWDGLGATGKPAPGGAYLVRVQAANPVGRVALTQPFQARRG